MTVIRVLFLADTHLGFDLPQRPRINRRRRGHDFFENFERTLDVAVQERVDFVIHGGDLFYRSRVPTSLVQQVFQPLKKLATAGIHVVLVPGNHERSRIPYPMLALHPRIHVFDRPRTFIVEGSGAKVALAGFPYYRHGVRSAFMDLLNDTGCSGVGADISLLCVHHTFEGATVGPSDYTFTYERDVVRLAEVPRSFAAVLSGHIHRHQVLTRDLRGRALDVPVVYPGSIERTSFAERDEPKGFLLLEFASAGLSGGILSKWEFRELPARPMVMADFQANGDAAVRLGSEIRKVIDGAPVDSILRLRIHGYPDEEVRNLVRAAHLRALAPATMNIEAVLVDARVQVDAHQRKMR
ncbi:MAG: metallophosphoesterase [Gemmatimonadota bacterium]|nr:MAG: metallophosphoesterase [Gemmatimonadota bacterium]